MRKLLVCLPLTGLTLFSYCVPAQNVNKTPRPAVAAPSGFFAELNSTPMQTAENRLTAAVNLATQAQDPRIVSLPTFTSSFAVEGQAFPYTMAGQQPSLNRTTTIPTSYVPLSFYFDEWVDQNGNNITIDATTIDREIRQSPLFQNAAYTTGDTQFVDAQMRAQFWSAIQNRRNDNYHVLLGTPTTLTPVTIEVPFGSSVVFVDGNGTYFALIDANFLESQLNTLLQLEPMDVHSIPIFLTRNAVYGEFSQGTPASCCIGGFHIAYVANQSANRTFVQTVAFATSLDPDVADSIFGDPGVFADVNALSHELAETVNDPFANNQTPSYQVPGAAPGVCGDTLEVADVVEDLSPNYTEMTMHGFTYHPQTLGLLQWFEGVTPSNAINGDYSFPDPSRLTSPYTQCGPVPIG